MKRNDQKISINQKLKNIAQKKDIIFSLVITEFLIERLLARILSDQNLNNSLIFKGGYVGLRVYNSPRYTVDLDALLLNANLRETLEKIKLAAAQDIGDCVWFAFEDEINLQTQGEYGGVRLVFRSGIGEPFTNIKKGQVIHFDLGIGDPVIPGPSKHQIQELIGGANLSWQVYPIETIIAEKLHALVSRGEASSRSKDIFDLCYYLPSANSNLLKNSLKACFDYRQTQLPTNMAEVIKKIDLTILRKGWPNATANIQNVPSCDDAFALLIYLLQDVLLER